MVNRTVRKMDDDAPVTGGVSLPSHLVAALTCDADVPNDDLGRQAFWLLKLNADKLSLQFRQSNLAAMDDDTKRQLIADIQAALDIAPFKKNLL